jgi:hypothetical protein
VLGLLIDGRTLTYWLIFAAGVVGRLRARVETVKKDQALG